MKLPLLGGLACALLCLLVGVSLLGVRHPHEDAYILYRYAEHLAGGHGIVWNLQGPRCEGATDFLWLVLLAGAVRAGLDVALAAALLNALGAGLLGGLLVRAAGRGALALAALAVPFSGAALAAHLGFSTLLYAALAGLAFAVLVDGRGRAVCALPVLGLLLALFRPDGVLLGFAFAALGSAPARSSGQGGRYARAALLCGLVAAAYFAWRWSYFGLLLPLPLYVKSQPNLAPEALPLWLPLGLRALAATALQGAGSSLRWLASGQGPLPLLAALALMSLRLRRVRPGELARPLLGLLPGLVLLVGLLPVFPSQNVAFRFQAPVFVLLVLALATLAARLAAAEPGRAARALAVLVALAALAPSTHFGVQRVAALWAGEGREYMDVLAPELGARLGPEQRVALTEAGRLAYWSRAHVWDVAGLNDPQTARTPPTLAGLRAWAPDVVMFHHADVLDPAQLLGAAPREPVVELAPDALRTALREPYRRLYAPGVSSYADAGGRARFVAPVVLARFLAESGDAYALFAVDYRGSGHYRHIWGVRPELLPRAELRELLLRATQLEGYRSYLEQKRAPGR